MYYSHPNLVLPELDNDPAIIKIIHDGEKLERENFRKELMEILKIPPPITSDSNQSTSEPINHQSIPTTPGSAGEIDQTRQIWIKRTVPITPNSNSYRRQHYRSALHQRSLNSSGNSLIDSPTHSLIKSARSDMNLSSSPMSYHKTSPVQAHSNTSFTPSGVIVTDYRQSTMMKRIVNPQWNIIPFT